MKKEYALTILVLAVSCAAVIALGNYSGKVSQEKTSEEKIGSVHLSSKEIREENLNSKTGNPDTEKNKNVDGQYIESSSSHGYFSQRNKQNFFEKIPVPQGAATMIAITAAVADNPKKSELMERSGEIGDFSHIPEEYKIIKAVSALGMKGVIASYPDSKQYMAVVDTGETLNITKSDLQTGRVEDKLLNFGQKILPSNIKVSKLSIIPQGSFYLFGQLVPIAEMRIRIEGINSKITRRGLIGVVTSPRDKRNHIIFSMDERGRYDKKIAKNYYKYINIY